MKGAPSHLLQQGELGTRRSNAIAPKIMVCVTADWFALSHFKPLLRALVSFARDVVIVTRWYGGKHLGGDRFRHVVDAVRHYLARTGR